ncbi:MAG: hypothetical protein P8Y53_16045 [Pseudolabrys sp.]|jgi:hypothetical protein
MHHCRLALGEPFSTQMQRFHANEQQIGRVRPASRQSPVTTLRQRKQETERLCAERSLLTEAV